MLRIISSFKNLLTNEIKHAVSLNQHQIGASFHSSATLDAKYNKNSRGPIKFLQHNKTVFEPTPIDEPPRPAVNFIIIFFKFDNN